MKHPIVKGFWHEASGSWQYVFHDPETMKGAIVDPVLDFDTLSGATGTIEAEKILSYIKENNIEVEWILDTHPHADHFSAAAFLAESFPNAKTGIGEKVIGVQKLWKGIYNFGSDFVCDGSEWNHLFADEETFTVGSIMVQVIFSPGHTMASVTYLAGNAAFVHDTLMMPDSGSSRADFPGGSSQDLYQSIQRILSLPADTRVFVGHDYAPYGRQAACEARVEDHLRSNIHFASRPDEASFRAVRDARDATLPLPKLMLAALQVNIRGGRVPKQEGNGMSYLKIPLNQFEKR